MRPRGEYVLYWMTAFRRLGWSFALEHAADRARELGRPLVILEALRCGHPWAADRFHRFVLDGMADRARRLAGSAVFYHPYVEPAPGEGRGLLQALAARACLVVGDDSPAFFFPRMLAAAARRIAVRVEAVDANGLLPLAAADRAFSAAVHFRRLLQRSLPVHLLDFPQADPLAAPLPPRHPGLPAEVRRCWPAASPASLESAALLNRLPIDHGVPPVPGVRGGEADAEAALERFLDERLERYGQGRNHPDDAAASGLSPYLHFGSLSSHRLVAAVAEREGWTPERLSPAASGAAAGWWGMSPGAEAFLDQAVTWREVGYNMARHRPGWNRYESLPEWALRTLERHRDDPRPHVYGLEDFEAGRTHDELWNAAQAQLVRDGRIHGYLRMIWGKKILHFSPSPRQALAVMLHLNDKYALDGRDPNSVSGIFWCLGRYDRPWPPERPVFGTVRYMSSESARRKLRLDGYLARYACGQRQLSLS